MSSPDQPNENLSIANELIKARTERGFSQAQLAESSGISRSAIKAYETGRNMPGSRELRALCIALKATPNKLLFGTEAPAFEDSDAAAVEAMLRSDPEETMVRRVRLALLAALITGDEYRSILQLVQSLAVARHGAERVKQTILAADFMAGISRSMLEHSTEAIRTGQPVDPASVVGKAEQFMLRQGHGPSSAGVGATDTEEDTKKSD